MTKKKIIPFKWQPCQFPLSPQVATLPRRSVRMRRDHCHRDRHRRLQQLDHLLVTQGRHRVLVDLHQPGSLPEAGLPGVAEVLHLGDEAVVLNVEAQLAKLVAAKGKFLEGKRKELEITYSIYLGFGVRVKVQY